jgi:hypothetical protein
MTPAEQALASAIHCEMVKCAYRQSKDGVVVSLVVHPQEVPEGLATAPLGTRYMVALVPIGDDERPIPPAAKEKSKPDSVSVKPLPEPDKPLADHKREKMDWRELQPAAQAGIRCAEPMFRAFLREVKRYGHCDEEDAAVAVRDICGVNSRADLGTKHAARVIWHQLDSEFLAWKALERV